MFARVTVVLTAMVLLHGCAEKKDEPPPDPPGTIVTELAIEGAGPNAIDFETGAVTAGGGDLRVDLLGNFVATDAIADAGSVDGLAEVEEIPPSGFVTTLSPQEGRGYVVKSDQSKAYRLVVELGPSGRTLRWGALPSFTLSIAPSGYGFGVATANLQGINCGPGNPTVAWDCAEPFNPGTTISINVVADEVECNGSVHVGWTDAACSVAGSAASCSVTMDQDRTVSPRFELVQLVSISTTGTTTGTITTPDTTLTCSGNPIVCTGSKVGDVSIQVTAVPDTGVFSTWSGFSQPVGECGPANGPFRYERNQAPSSCTTSPVCLLAAPESHYIYFRAIFN